MPNLCLHVLDAWPHALALLPWGQKHASGDFRRLRLLRRNRVRMDVEFLRQLRQRLVILKRCQSDLRFNRRHMVPSWSYHHRSLGDIFAHEGRLFTQARVSISGTGLNGYISQAIRRCALQRGDCRPLRSKHGVNMILAMTAKAESAVEARDQRSRTGLPIRQYYRL